MTIPRIAPIAGAKGIESSQLEYGTTTEIGTS